MVNYYSIDDIKSELLGTTQYEEWSLSETEQDELVETRWKEAEWYKVIMQADLDNNRYLVGLQLNAADERYWCEVPMSDRIPSHYLAELLSVVPSEILYGNKVQHFAYYVKT